MSAGPASALAAPQAGAPQIAGSAVVHGKARLGEGSLLAPGAVIRSPGRGVEIGTGSAVLENSVVVGHTGIPASIGRRSVVRASLPGHRSSRRRPLRDRQRLDPHAGARLGDRVFLGEGTSSRRGCRCPATSSPSVGRPA